MQKSRIKKGFSLIEVLCAFMIFSIVFTGVMKIMLNALELKKQNELMKNQSEFLYAVKYNIMYNISYDNLLYIYDCGKKNINGNKLTLDYIKDHGLEEILSNNTDYILPYGIMEIEKGEVLKVNVKIVNSEKNNKKNLNITFYKGKNL
ncbi:prepilin-type N-terminal cleavage/methylation domain-containing protein [Clostridium sp. JN-9]|uniref:type IV pilus modification PilV family protein n=1 Tax=Clostridium sp. JN-9 TaxID=2507159 RepID=UPI000FFE24BA|nr:prepilin-type N-terminal cleavage/methylation domain-containing protein [Clostridium sp. JN-9]QAT40040.1 prepilin-type N-terminal cleavage/methylation domain-containing protein [Clostridium sp. JN-9]